VDDPIGKSVIHHLLGELGQGHFVAVQVYAARRAMAREIKRAVVSFAEKIKIVFQLIAGIACKMAEFRFRVFEISSSVGKTLRRISVFPVPQRLKAGDISFTRAHYIVKT
jgi:hypothetical protein